MKTGCFIVMILLFCSCSSTVRKLKAVQHPFITVDSNKYDYYIREYYTTSDETGFVVKSRQDLKSSENARLIEVEYLFISKDDKNHVLYMTTVPDRRQNRYSTYYLGNDSVNMFDVRMLHFGLLTGISKDSFYFSAFKKGSRDIWKIDRSADGQKLIVNSIYEEKRNELNQVFIPGASLESPVVFEKVSGFVLVHHDHFKEKWSGSSVEQNRIFYKPGVPGELYLFYSFRQHKESHVMRFKGKQIVYDPKSIFR